MDYYTKKVKPEEEELNKKAEEENSFERLKEALEEAGLHTKKVYH